MVFPICSNPLLRIGLETVLLGGAFNIWPEAVDDISVLPRTLGGENVLFIIDGQNYSDDAVSIINQIKTRFPDARIVILSEKFEPDAVCAAWQAGAHGFCLSNSQREIIVGSLDLVMLGEIVLPSAFILSLTASNAGHTASATVQSSESSEDYPSLGRKLSIREAQILDYLRQGAPNKVIARKLSLSESTVKVHVKAILKKIGACNRTQAALWATRRFSSDAEV
ncbi:two-component system nitrate/nitrite response regulator NarL [Microvirga lupini]|uniref:Two-component system nitrate/nitrite response regulator NarL n=1 Tax=Microvirga lupini TaxID=420324 RepID=A0A7W4YVN7_9HYPH|nr:response regulator transcription factor [Microvirga lupini]MBB3017389.1 two-component system nitrate/nitrite response regulator NarL [Microvirga lupini]